MSLLSKISLAIVISIIAVPSIIAQSDYINGIGFPTTGAQLPTLGGTVDATTGNLHIEIPLGSPTQRGDISLNPRLIYDSRIWTPVQVNGNYIWEPDNVGTTYDDSTAPSGWRFTIGTANNNWGSVVTLWTCGIVHNPYYFTDAEGTTHNFNIQTVQPYPDYYAGTGTCGYNSSAQGYASDESGYFGSVTNYGLTVYDPDGKVVSGFGLNTTCVPNCVLSSVPNIGSDANGNYNSTDANGNLIDTRGQTPVIVTNSGNTTTYAVLTPGGGRANYVVTYTTVGYSTNFGESGVQENSGSFKAISSIQLPDGSSYSFQYENYLPTYGELTQMTLPQGGIIQYQYVNFTDVYGETNQWVSWVNGTDYIAGGNPGYTQYTPQITFPCAWTTPSKFFPQLVYRCQQSTTVTRAWTGDDTVFTTTQDNNYAWGYQTDYYTGSSKATGAAPLTSIVTTSNYAFPHPYADGEQFLYPLPLVTDTTVTTILANGLKSMTYESYLGTQTGLPASIQSWDYYTGITPPAVPDRETDYQYQLFNLRNYKLQNKQIYGETHHLLSSTAYGYDETAPTATSGLPQHGAPPSAARGNLTSVTRSGSSKVTFAYDDAGVLQAIVPPNGNAPGANPAQWQTSFAYDPTDTYLVSTMRPSTNGIAHIATVTPDPYTGVVTQKNDENSVSLGSTLPVTYTYFQSGPSIGKLQSIIYPDGGSTTYSYPSPAQVQKIVARPGGLSDVIIDSVDPVGRPSQHIDNVVTTDLVYDQSGRLQCITNPYKQQVANPTDGVRCVMAFDGLNRPLIVQNQDGTKKYLSYSGNTVTVTDESGHVMGYTDDAFGNITQVSEPSGNGFPWITTYSYDGLGRRTQAVQNGDGTEQQIRTWIYDALGNLVSEQTPESGITCFGISIGANCTPSYDADGNLSQKVDANQNTVTYFYDNLDRLTNVTATPLSGAAISNTYTYDGPQSGSSIITANAVGRLVQQMSSSGTGQWFSYDSLGRITSETNCLPSACATGINTVAATYNIDGTIRTLIYPDGTQLNPNYNAGGQLTTIQSPNMGGGYVISQTTYYPTGRISSELTNSISKNIGVDSRGNINTLSYGPFLSNSPFWSKGYDWDWNAKNLNNEVDLSTGNTRHYSYDQINRLVAANDSGAGTKSVGTLTISGADGTHLFCPSTDYIPNQLETPGLSGAPSQTANDDWTDFVCVDSAGAHTPPTGCSLDYDTGNLSVSTGGFDVSVPYNHSSTIWDLTFGLMYAINTTPQSPVTATAISTSVISLTSKASGSEANYTLTFPSSPDFQITPSGATMTGGSDSGQRTGLQETYSYDPWGNMQQQGNFTFTPSLGISTANNQIPTAQYDSAGNMQTSPLGLSSFTFDALQQMSSANQSVTFTYDATGNRVVKSSGGGSNEYIYFGGKLLAVHNTASNTWNNFVYDNDGERILQGSAAQTPLFTPVLTDIHGDTVALLNSTAGVTEQHDYAPYGQMMARSSGDFPYQFLGMEYEPTSNSYDSMTREYAAAESRWVSPDSYEGSYDPLDPQSLNRYSYVNGRPGNLSDPSGMEPGDPTCYICWINIFADILDLFKTPSVPVRPDIDQVDAMKHLPGGVIPTGLPTHISILNGMGLPGQQGCEFGVCIMNLTQGKNASGNNPFPGIISDAAWLWASTGIHYKSHGLWTYGNWCGKDGSDNPTGRLDAACLTHDYCYYQNHFTADSNGQKLPPGQAAALQSCNQNLCDLAGIVYAEGGPHEALSVVNYFKESPRKEQACR